jgi:hypothetical protein
MTYIRLCRVVCVTYRRVLDWMIGFINTLYTQLSTTGNYRAIADLHTLQFTVTQIHTYTHTHTSVRLLNSPLVVSWQRIYNSCTVTSNHT